MMVQQRRDVVVESFRACGIDPVSQKGTFCIWAPLPKKVERSKERHFDALGKIAVRMIPGSMYGKHGEGYFRIAPTQPKYRLEEAMAPLQGLCSWNGG